MLTTGLQGGEPGDGGVPKGVGTWQKQNSSSGWGWGFHLQMKKEPLLGNLGKQVLSKVGTGSYERPLH